MDGMLGESLRIGWRMETYLFHLLSAMDGFIICRVISDHVESSGIFKDSWCDRLDLAEFGRCSTLANSRVIVVVNKVLILYDWMLHLVIV